MARKYNVFISHHGKDDDHLQRLKGRIRDVGYNIRNSSIDSTKYQEHRPSDHFISKKLRMHIRWASTFICLVGEKTHTRPWVDYEIKQAIKQGKQIVGIYKYGCNNNVQIPERLKTFGGPVLGWNSGVEKIGDILKGMPVPSENVDGSVRTPIYRVVRIKCGKK